MKENRNKQGKIQKVMLFRIGIIVEVGIRHQRAFEEYWSALQRKCEEFNGLQMTRILNRGQLIIILGNTYRIEISGVRKKDVKFVADHIDRWFEEESKNPQYDMM